MLNFKSHISFSVVFKVSSSGGRLEVDTAEVQTFFTGQLLILCFGTVLHGAECLFASRDGKGTSMVQKLQYLKTQLKVFTLLVFFSLMLLGLIAHFIRPRTIMCDLTDSELSWMVFTE